MDDLEGWPEQFPILSRTVYMVNHSFGAMPRQTATNVAEYPESRATRARVSLHAARSAEGLGPSFTGWLLHRTPFAFDTGPVEARHLTSAASRDPARLAGTVVVNVPDAPLVSRALRSASLVI